MSQTLQQILGAPNLTGVIQATTTGVPDVFPAGFYASRKPVDGDTGEYTQVTGTRRTARIAAYGSPSQQRELKDVAKKPVKLLHTIESVNHNPTTLVNLLQYDSLAKQQLGLAEVTRQTREFRQLFDNLRVAALTSALATGKIYFDGSGNLLNSSSGAVITVDYGVPTGNQGQLNWDGNGALLDAGWQTNTTKILTQIARIKKAARKLTGYPIKYAFYGENVPDYIFSNTAYRDFLKLNPANNVAALSGEIGAFGGLTWIPAYEAFFEDNNGTNQSIVGADSVIFTPEPSMDWLEWLEGTYPLPTSIGAITADGVSAMQSMSMATGMFSYGQVLADPATVKQVAGDTFLPVVKVPAALWQATVNF